MDRDGAHRIVHLEHVLDERHADADQHAGDEADDRRARRADESARGGDCHESREKTVAGHRCVGLALGDPHVEDGAERPGAAGQHRRHGDGADPQVAVG